MIFFSFCFYLLQDGNNKQAVPKAGSEGWLSSPGECHKWEQGGRMLQDIPRDAGEGGKSDFECKGNENSGHAGMSP